MAFPDRRTANVLLTVLLFAGVLAIVYVALIPRSVGALGSLAFGLKVPVINE